ncbi:MAG: hypothetical protein IPP99_05860 [Chitinophagaceae bacterium]|nr:hypothetical protein [Chitinophagaceae bacterium]
MIADGFGNSENQINSLRIFGTRLYAIIENFTTGIEVWQTTDGANWQQVGFGGFGDSNNSDPYWDNSVTVFNNNLFIGTTNWANGGEIWNMDINAPTAFSSLRVNNNPTSAASVNFTVTFSKPVTGVDTVMPFADFALTTDPGISGASITGVTPVSGSVYTVTVNTGNGNGTIRLDVVDNNSIVDLLR